MVRLPEKARPIPPDWEASIMSKPGSPQTAKRTPSAIERIIGLLILATVAGLVFVFFVSGGLFGGVVDRCPVLGRLKRVVGVNEARLFDIAPGRASPASPPVELQIARKLLPAETPGSYERGVESAHLILSADKMEILQEVKLSSGEHRIERTPAKPDGITKQAADLGARCVYWVFYVKSRTRDRGFQVIVVDAGDPANAVKLCQARKKKGAKELMAGREGWITESPAACGFWAGRYYSELWSQDGVLRGAEDLAVLQNAAQSLAANQLAYGDQTESTPPRVTEAATKPAPAVARVADFAAVPGGQTLPPTKIDRFTDNLYEKIDGKEGMFRAFHFVELRFGQYTHAQTQEGFDVYIYDMAEPVNAFGIYMGERSPTAEAWSLGRDAYVSGISAYFCKDKYYVNVLGPPDGAADRLEVSKAIATAIAATVPDTDKPFWVEQYLPAEGRVPNSLKYEATSALGYDFIQRLFRVEYNVGGKTFQLFVVKADDPAAARGLFDKYAEATAKYDKVLSKEADAQGQKMVGESLGVFAAAFTKGVFFGGVSECEDQALAVKQAEAFRAMLPGEGAGMSEPSPKPASAPAAEEQG